MQTTNDTRVVYGARCMWWGDVKDAGTVGVAYKIPCCPHCRGLLFEMDRDEFMRQAEKYEQEKPAPGYVERLKWSKGKCFATYADAVVAFDQFKAEEVK